MAHSLKHHGSFFLYSYVFLLALCTPTFFSSCTPPLLCKNKYIPNIFKNPKMQQHSPPTLSSSFAHRLHTRTALLSQRRHYSISWHRKTFFLVVTSSVSNDLVVVWWFLLTIIYSKKKVSNFFVWFKDL